MKKTGLLLVLCLAMAARLRSKPTADAADQPAPDGTVSTKVSFPIERIADPDPCRSVLRAASSTSSCCPMPTSWPAAWKRPNTTQVCHRRSGLSGRAGLSDGQAVPIVRELRDPNRYELFAGQHAMLKAMGQPYCRTGPGADRGHPQQDARSRTVEFSCEPVVPGDIADTALRKSPRSPSIRRCALTASLRPTARPAAAS